MDFYPLVWSPNGKYLAFGAAEELNTNWKLFVVDADGDNLRKLVDRERPFDDEGEKLDDFRWNTQSTRIYFTGFMFGEDNGLSYYVIDVDGGKPQRISEAEYLAVRPPDTLSIANATECDKAPYIKFRTIHPDGLIAQNACLNAEYFSWSDPWATHVICNYELQVCDSSTGDLVFAFDEHDFRGKLWQAVVFLMVLLILA